MHIDLAQIGINGTNRERRKLNHPSFNPLVFYLGASLNYPLNYIYTK